MSAPPKPEEDPALRLGIGMDASVRSSHYPFSSKSQIVLVSSTRKKQLRNVTPILDYLHLLSLLKVTPIPGKTDTLLAQTTDFFYPLVDDPYMQVLCLYWFLCMSFLVQEFCSHKKEKEWRIRKKR